MYREAYHLNSRDISWSDYTGKELGTESIHIYKASLNPTRDEVKDLLHLLSLDEIERASKYYFTKDRNRYIKSR